MSECLFIFSSILPAVPLCTPPSTQLSPTCFCDFRKLIATTWMKWNYGYIMHCSHLRLFHSIWGMLQYQLIFIPNVCCEWRPQSTAMVAGNKRRFDYQYVRLTTLSITASSYIEIETKWPSISQMTFSHSFHKIIACRFKQKCLLKSPFNSQRWLWCWWLSITRISYVSVYWHIYASNIIDASINKSGVGMPRHRLSSAWSQLPCNFNTSIFRNTLSSELSTMCHKSTVYIITRVRIGHDGIFDKYSIDMLIWFRENKTMHCST